MPVLDVPGIGWKDSSGKCHVQEPVFIKSEENFPCTDLDLADVSHYKRMDRRSIVTVSSRGCPMSCSYCSFGNSRYRYRHRSVESVVTEIKHNIQDETTCFIDFEDEHLSLKKSWFMDLLNQLIFLFKGRQVELRAMNGLFPPSLDREVVTKMKEAGFKTLNLSLGSSSVRQLNRFNRPDMLNHLDSALMYADENSLNAVCYIIAGAPYQTPESSLNDLLFLAGRRTLAGVSVYYPAPGSADFEQYTNENLFPDKLGLFRSSAIPVSHSTTRKESVTLLRLGRILNFMKHLTDKHGYETHSLLKNHKKSITPDRDALGIFLLNKFLKTGIIYGATSDQKTYQHTISHKLCQNFLSGLDHVPVRGVKTNHQVQWKG